jgi:hypothetical protein
MRLEETMLHYSDSYNDSSGLFFCSKEFLHTYLRGGAMNEQSLFKYHTKKTA